MSNHDSLDEVEMDELDRFLLERGQGFENYEGRDEGLLGLSELDGFFTAIVSGPETILPSEWLPAVWGEDEPDWGSVESFDKIYQLMIRHFNDVVSSLMAPGFAFEPIFNENEVDGQRYTVVDEWCIGYMKGVALRAEAWDEGGDELFDMLQPILLFSGEPGWEVLDTLEEDEVADLQVAIPAVAQDIHRFWLTRRGFPTVENEEALLVDNPLDPDGPCPCGSGRPFRKCCLH
jgi:uncharacterized protein